MKLPSVSFILRNAAQTIARFPAALVTAAAGTVCAVLLIGSESEPGIRWLMNVVFAASLGIPLLVTAVLVSERRGWNPAAPQLAVIVVLALYGFLLPGDILTAAESVVYRHVMFLIAAHLLVAFAPYLGPDEMGEFWQYNKTLFLRALEALFFSQALWAGLAVALAALRQLFGVDIPGVRYPQLWVAILGIFNTWFFLAGVPRRGEPAQPYPRGLRIFTQYVLVPLVAVYLVILYAYAGKILVEWNWPQGWVSMLILGFSTTGILALLLVHPLRDGTEHRWVRALWQWYYVVLVPLVVLLMFATYRRVTEYGITENRYTGVALAFWLAGITVYFIVSRRQNIKVIPITLCIFGFLLSWGPWGAFSVSRHSQLGRLERILERNGMLVEGKVRPATQVVPVADVKDINSVVRYLVTTHGDGVLQPLFAQRLDTLCPPWAAWAPFERANRIVALMGVEQTADVPTRPREFRTDATSAGVEGYAFLASVGVPTASYDIPGHGSVTVESCRDSLAVVVRAAGPPAETLSVDLRPLCAALAKPRSGRSASQEELTAEAAGAVLRVKVVLRRILCPREDERVDPMNISGIALIGFRQQ